MAENSNHQITSMRRREKNGFFCFSCLGKGRPISSLIPEEISSVLNGNDQDSVYQNEHKPASKDKQPCNITGNPDDNSIHNDNQCDKHTEDEEDDNPTYEICQISPNHENIELQSRNSENPGCSINSITVTNTTSPSHMSLSQAPTNTISSQLSSHRFPSTGISSPPPPLKCAFLVRYHGYFL